MLVDVPLLANSQVTNKKKQQLAGSALMKENVKRIQHNCATGDKVMMKSYDPKKLDPKLHGPHLITQVFTNGAVKTLRNGTVEETASARKLHPRRGDQRRGGRRSS